VPVPALEWREAARADLLAILDYISDDNPDAAQRLKDEVEGKASKLPEHPKLYRAGRVAGTREMVVRTNYNELRGDLCGRRPRRINPARVARHPAMAAGPGMR
jgi:toxin ParE1/3/4